MTTNTLKLNNVSVDIPIFDASRSFRRSIANRLGGDIQRNEKRKVCVRALDNISFTIQTGDRVGLIGHNGAGKTTLLRLLGHIYKPTRGRYICNGNITSLFNMTLGMDLDDTGVENMRTIGSFLGMSRTEIEAKKDSIIEFSELGDYIHLPMRTYSAGMMTRLSFALATALEPDILLMDEGIGAGDANFADKAEARLKSFYGRLNTLIIASHSDELIRKLCNKAILLEHGKIKAVGAVDDILEQYHG